MASAAALRAFEAPANQPYSLGRGDELTVTVLGRPELTSKYIIGPDGTITLPIAGSVKIADMTREEAAAALQNALRPFYTDAFVTVGVDKYTSNQLLVLGAVSRPGLMNFDRTPTLLEAITRANGGNGGGSDLGGYGGGGGGGGGTGGTGRTGTQQVNIPEEVLIYRGDDTMVTVLLKALVESGSPLANIRLKRDDIIFVTGKTSYVSVLGQVYRPGNQHLDVHSSITDLLAEAGGPTEKAGTNPTIQIIHRDTTTGQAKVQNIAMNDILHHNLSDYTLRSGDILWIPESGFNKASYVFQQISPLVNLFTIATLFNR
jgi:polysaccharide export outer membrane protein